MTSIVMSRRPTRRTSAEQPQPRERSPRVPPTLEELYDRHGPALWAYARLLSGSGVEAEDAVQNCFARLAEHPERLAAADDPRSYLFTVLRNEALRLRSRWRRWRHGDRAAGTVPVAGQAPGGAEQAEEAERLRRAVMDLPGEQREVVFLKVWQEMTFAEVARLLNIPANTAASRYRYGMEKLRARIHDEQ
jgi:RNA polymerase sigma-70 factor (ECF subfamily)